MSYKISGIASENSRILVINQSDWSLETTNSGTLGNFEISGLAAGKKLVLARNSLGKISGFGGVDTIQAGGDRGVFGGGYNAGDKDIIDYITISSDSNAVLFGNLTVPRAAIGCTSNGGISDGLFIGGSLGTGYDVSNVIDCIIIDTLDNAILFGYLSTGRRYTLCTSNSRNDVSVFGGGYTQGPSGSVSLIDYVTTSTKGDSVLFGNLTISRWQGCAVSNSVNDDGLFIGGRTGLGSALNIIDHITISTTSDAVDFGDLIVPIILSTSTSNGINNRGVIAGGHLTNAISYITIGHVGNNAVSFGELTQNNYDLTSLSNMEFNRGVFAGGNNGITNVGTMEYISIDTECNGITFGELIEERYGLGGASNA